MSLYAKHVKQAVADVLEATGQAVYYHRAEGNYLYYRNEQGEDVQLLDLLGGYGAVLLGHNPPEILATAHKLLERQVPMHTQFSLREGAGRLAARLNEIVARQTGGETFNVTFANSGAEAVEVALKHAELDRVLSLEELLDEIDVHLTGVEAEVRAIPGRRHRQTLGHPDPEFAIPLGIQPAAQFHLRRGRIFQRNRRDAAREDGCVVAGLGMYTSIVTNNCTALRANDIALTSGNALTIAMGLEAVERASGEAGLRASQATVAVVGAAGNIATTYTALLAQQVGRVLLIGSARDGSKARLTRTAHGLYEEIWRNLRAGIDTRSGEFTLAVRELESVRQWLATGHDPGRDAGRLIAEAMTATYGEDRFLALTIDTGTTRQAEIVVCAANTDRPFLDGGSFREGAVICDIAVPNNVVPDIGQVRPDIRYLQGGIVATPYGESLHPTARAFLEAGQLFACMAETAVLGLAAIRHHYSYGPVTTNQVREIGALARLHGFRLGATKQAASY